MTLDRTEKERSYKIVSIKADEELKKRFNSFGIRRGVELIVREFAIGKKVLKIEIEHSLIAIRVGEAQKIEVKQL